MKTFVEGSVITLFQSVLGNLNELGNILPSDILPARSYSEVLSYLVKREKSPLFLRAVDDLTSGRITFLFGKRFEKIPSFLPMIGRKMPNGAVNVVVNMNLYGKMKEVKGSTEKLFDIQARTLYGILIGAHLYRISIENENRIFNSAVVLKGTCSFYAAAMVKALDRNYGISSNGVAEDQIRYLFAKFFLINVLGKEQGDMINNYALAAVTKTSASVVQLIDKETDTETFATLESFLSFLVVKFSRLEKLTIRSLYGQVANMFRSPAIMMVEFAPYVLINIAFFIAAANINNEAAIAGIVKKEHTDIFTEIYRLS